MAAAGAGGVGTAAPPIVTSKNICKPGRTGRTAQLKAAAQVVQETSDRQLTKRKAREEQAKKAAQERWSAYLYKEPRESSNDNDVNNVTSFRKIAFDAKLFLNQDEDTIKHVIRKHLSSSVIIRKETRICYYNTLFLHATTDLMIWFIESTEFKSSHARFTLLERCNHIMTRPDYEYLMTNCKTDIIDYIRQQQQPNDITNEIITSATLTKNHIAFIVNVHDIQKHRHIVAKLIVKMIRARMFVPVLLRNSMLEIF
jgi:hypothetical protein